ncbi:hypothetical protein GCM10029964_129010 [Kibdelosporangium lantanae]
MRRWSRGSNFAAPRALSGIVLVVAFLLQMTAQVSEAEESPAGWAVAATPALAFLVVVKLAMRRGRIVEAETVRVYQPISADRVGQSPNPVDESAGVGEVPQISETKEVNAPRQVWPPAA